MSKAKVNAFDGFTFEKPETSLLPEGNNTVRVHSTSRTDSFHLLSGVVKTGLLEKIAEGESWSDSTPQLAVVFVSYDKDGVMTYRFNALGYKNIDDFTEEELNDEKYTVIGKYVCVTNKQDKLVRIKDENRTKKAQRILNQFLMATGAETGEGLDDILDRCIADKTPLNILVTKDQYDGRDTYDIDKFSAVAELEPANEGLDDGEF